MIFWCFFFVDRFWIKYYQIRWEFPITHIWWLNTWNLHWNWKIFIYVKANFFFFLTYIKSTESKAIIQHKMFFVAYYSKVKNKGDYWNENQFIQTNVASPTTAQTSCLSSLVWLNWNQRQNLHKIKRKHVLKRKNVCNWIVYISYLISALYHITLKFDQENNKKKNIISFTNNSK